MEERRAALVAKARAAVGIDPKAEAIPDEARGAVREVLVSLLEEGENVAARDAIRIAHAWVNKHPTPNNWRFK